MADYTSKIVRIRRSAEQIYGLFSDFTQFSAMIPKDKLEDFEATESECSFTAKPLGRTGIAIVAKEPNSYVKYGPNGNKPFDFFFWVQMKEVAPYDTRIKLTLRAELNFMMKTMIGKKLQKGLDQFAEQLAAALNGQTPPA